MINIFSGMSEFYGVRPPCQGADLVRHEYRENNTIADNLTHQAREGHQHKWIDVRFLQHPFSNVKCVGLRGAFDGGKDDSAVACGAWLEIAASMSGGAVRWIPIYRECYLISCQASVTEAELSAAESLVEASLFVLASIAECDSL